MARRITDEQRIEEYFRTRPEAEVKAMGEKVALMLRFRNVGEFKQPVGRPRKQRAGGAIDVKMREPEIPRVDSPGSGKP